MSNIIKRCFELFTKRQDNYNTNKKNKTKNDKQTIENEND